MDASDMKELRVILDNINVLNDEWFDTFQTDEGQTRIHDALECEIIKADKILAKRPRNCDVGTAEEQRERFKAFCRDRQHGSCDGCPIPKKRILHVAVGADAIRGGGRSGEMIEGQCELCTNYVDELYDASALADAFGMCASFSDDDAYYVCGDCLNNIESMVKAAWQKKEGGAE